MFDRPTATQAASRRRLSYDLSVRSIARIRSASRVATSISKQSFFQSVATDCSADWYVASARVIGLDLWQRSHSAGGQNGIRCHWMEAAALAATDVCH